MATDSLTPEEQLRQLRRFAEIVLEDFTEFSMDGGDIQDAAERCGLLEAVPVTEACGEGCQCAEFGFPTECMKRTDLLIGPLR